MSAAIDRMFADAKKADPGDVITKGEKRWFVEWVMQQGDVRLVGLKFMPEKTDEQIAAINRMLQPAQQKRMTVEALDETVSLLALLQKQLRDPSLEWTSGERQSVAVTLEQLGRVAWSIARESERKALPAPKEGVGL